MKDSISKNGLNNFYKLIFFFITINLLFSCMNNVYYKTFDYSTMTFKQSAHKSENCVKLLTQTNNKIEMEVFFYGNKTKRTFIKRENYWYSKVKYKLSSIPELKVAYDGIHEAEYFIFKNHIIFNYDDFLFYVDLLNKKIYRFTDISNLDINNYINKNIENITNKNDYSVIEYNIYYDELYKYMEVYDSNGKLIDNVKENTYYDKNLDIFYLIDYDLYSYIEGREFIYDN